MNFGSVFSSLFRSKANSCLGIDLGASSIKIAELSKEKEGISLKNYVLARAKENSKIDLAKLPPEEVALIIRHMVEKAGIKTKKAVISLPVSETFSTVIDLPEMTEKELSQTIPFEARKYVPIPIEEVVLDWSVTAETVQSPQISIDSSGEKNTPPSGPASPKGKKTLHILIVAVPREMIKRIAEIAGKAGLEVLALEQESFCMARSLAEKREEIYMVADMGTDSLDAVVIEQGAIKLIHSFRESNPENMLLDIPKILGIFEAKYAKKINKIIFTGGHSANQGLVESASAKIDRKIFPGNPFLNIKFNTQLSGALKEISPYMAVAVGGAMREI